jgi:hypothetical protein
MPLHREAIGLWLTDREDCLVYVKHADGTEDSFPASIDPTYVRGAGFIKWVDSCVLAAVGQKYSLHLVLDRERVVGSVAQPMNSTGWLTDNNDGESYKVNVSWPASRSHAAGRDAFGRPRRIADAVIASGKWTN